MTMTEANLMNNINAMASTMMVLNMHQDSDQPVTNFIAQLKAAARQFNFKVQCKCTVKCQYTDFTDLIVLYKLEWLLVTWSYRRNSLPRLT